MPRPLGLPNKNKKALLLLLQAKYPNYHPIVELADIAMDMSNDVMIRLNANKEVAQYVEPKLKAVELTDKDGNSPFESFAQAIAELADS